MSNWYQHLNWDDEAHQDFYQHYRQAEAEKQELALLHQAELLSKHLDNTTLKAAESLLILWMSQHFNTENAARVYELMQAICTRIGDHDRAKDFKNKLDKINAAPKR
ncbi:hypothetical protein [Croceimicrobium sp.]|uniref:hypothetical protein n=1 Tax=Croceimicrobium sp. TaxID=2828340 RepID=UPI003BA871CE